MSAAPSEVPLSSPFELLASGEVPTTEQAVELLSYADVLVGEERQAAITHTTESANGLKYAETLREMIETQGVAVQHAVEDMQADFSRSGLTACGVEPSKYSKSPSWILWDLAKQKYLFDHPDESSDHYTLADPFGSEQSTKRQEIVDRQVGWELDRAIKAEEIDRRKLPAGLEVDHIVRNSPRHADGQLPSYELARIGAEIRQRNNTLPGSLGERKQPIDWDEWYRENAPHLVQRGVQKGVKQRLRGRLKR